MPRTNVIATVDPSAVASSLEAAAKQGKATFYVRRSDNTFRRMAYLPPNSSARRTAEKVEKQRLQSPPVSMKDIAKEMHVSIPTVRRILNNLELSRHVEAGDMTYAVAMANPGNEVAQPVTVPAPRKPGERPRTNGATSKAS